MLGIHLKPSRWAVIPAPLNPASCTRTMATDCHSRETIRHPPPPLLCPATLGPQPQMLIWVSISHCPGTGNLEQRDPVPLRVPPKALISGGRRRSEPFFTHCFSVFGIIFHPSSELCWFRKWIPGGAGLRMLMFLLCILSRRAFILICVSDSHVTHVVPICVQVFGPSDVVFLLLLFFVFNYFFFLH